MVLTILNNYILLHPWFLLLLALIPVIGVWYYRQMKLRYPTLQLSSLEGVKDMTTWRVKLRWLAPVLRAAAFALFVFALARPQLTLKEEDIKAEGIDIILVMDLSSSMLARDFEPDRLEVSKKVAAEFVNKRPYDRIGLVVFSGEAFTQCPLTMDHRVVKEYLQNLKCGILEDGTAIGMGLATAVNRIIDSETKSKVVILLTDGVNNAGYIQPMMSADMALESDIRVYTIGVGSVGDALAPVSRLSDGRFKFGISRVEIDEELLQEIAEMTGGEYFRATSEKGLEEIYDKIDSLEKTEIEVTTIKRYSEEYHVFLFLGFMLLLMELVLRYTIFRAIP
ncbi:MAG: VWA domain-containing protein [Bacteroidota bacterium]